MKYRYYGYDLNPVNTEITDFHNLVYYHITSSSPTTETGINDITID